MVFLLQNYRQLDIKGQPIKPPINIFTSKRGGQTFYIGCSGGYDNVNKEMDVSKANKLSAGTRISYLQLAKLNQIEPR